MTEFEAKLIEMLNKINDQLEILNHPMYTSANFEKYSYYKTVGCETCKKKCEFTPGGMIQVNQDGRCVNHENKTSKR